MLDASDISAARVGPDEGFAEASRQRAAVLRELRGTKMARSAHAYVRGSTERFYAWLESAQARVPSGPNVWICGDCHVGNLGPIADADGRVWVEIRDLDQTVIGNPAHDLIRLGLSLTMAAKSADLPGVTAARIIEQLTLGYESALRGPFSKDDAANRPKTIQRVLRSSVRRRWKHLATDRLDDPSPELPIGKRFWPLLACEEAAIAAIVGSEAGRRLVTCLKGRDSDAEVELVDAAYWIKGCSSLGRLRYAAIVRVGGRDGDLCLIDLKEAAKAAAPSAPDAEMPADNAERVAAGARALSPSLGGRMMAARMLDKPVFVRELLPQDLKIEIEQLDCDEAQSLAHYLAHVVGRAHARQMRPAQRKAWRATLASDRRGSLDAPGWLWSSIVELVGLHEPAYLEHCRQHVLSRSDG